MKITTLSLSLAIIGSIHGAVLDTRDSCIADNCLRALRGRYDTATSDSSLYIPIATTTYTR